MALKTTRTWCTEGGPDECPLSNPSLAFGLLHFQAPGDLSETPLTALRSLCWCSVLCLLARLMQYAVESNCLSGHYFWKDFSFDIIAVSWRSSKSPSDGLSKLQWIQLSPDRRRYFTLDGWYIPRHLVLFPRAQHHVAMQTARSLSYSRHHTGII